jgi:hypothetical protein
MNNSGFYKKEETGNISRADAVYTPNGDLTADNKEETLEGWRWFESPEEAYTYYANPTADSYYAEEWIERQGYPAMRLISLKDFEEKLAASNKVSDKLVAVRSWINLILATYAMNPAPRSDWPQVPFSFENVVQEAFIKLTE